MPMKPARGRLHLPAACARPTFANKARSCNRHSPAWGGTAEGRAWGAGMAEGRAWGAGMAEGRAWGAAGGEGRP